MKNIAFRFWALSLVLSMGVDAWTPCVLADDPIQTPYAPPAANRELPYYQWTYEKFSTAVQTIEKEVNQIGNEHGRIVRAIGLTASLAFVIKTESAPFKGFDPKDRIHILRLTEVETGAFSSIKKLEATEKGWENFSTLVLS